MQCTDEERKTKLMKNNEFGARMVDDSSVTVTRNDGGERLDYVSANSLKCHLSLMHAYDGSLNGCMGNNGRFPALWLPCARMLHKGTLFCMQLSRMQP